MEIQRSYLWVNGDRNKNLQAEGASKGRREGAGGRHKDRQKKASIKKRDHFGIALGKDVGRGVCVADSSGWP